MMRRVCWLVLLTAAAVGVNRAGGQPKYTEKELKAKDRQHWAFVPPKRPAVPEIADRKSPTANPIDAFILARLEKDGLKPSPPADKLALVRRVTLDLTGLPPTPEEVDAFLKDDAPDAYEKVVDRLLASPHFGERQAQHWLDVVRFAESDGYELDGERPHAWRYRDYAVKSFNADKPYDRFVLEQLAGDELAAEKKDPERRPELLVATGLHRCGPVHMVSGNLDAEVLRQEVLTEMVNGASATFLGLTFACARCHDHKFDPISAGDYYRLQAFFANARYADIDFATPAERDARNKAVEELRAQLGPVNKQIADLDSPVRSKLAKEKRESLEPKYKEALDTPADKRTPEQKTLASQAGTLLKVSWDEILAAMPPADLARRAKLREQQHALEARMPPPTAAAWAIENKGDAKTFVLRRGEVKQKTLEVRPAFPRVLQAEKGGQADKGDAPKSRRELAAWLTRPDHPLTARVIVNRLWQQHFGRGLVSTPNDFGTRGERPTHPDLLDWLACELADPGRKAGGAGAPAAWSLKHLHRLMVTSATYRQSATAPPGAKVDADNKLLWKMPRRRLEAEGVRDSILAAAGTLNREIG
ncbi:MAG: DUF1549 and DUF1553 domain-containing protein, partial [Gemmataceae bacterium]|nr:DUF1549 and DUF1553 domain-containing protein [Gemmataceae bacterium]